MWHSGLSFFETPVNITDFLDETVHDMMLRGDEVSKDSRAKGTLIGDTDEGKHVASLMIVS